MMDDDFSDDDVLTLDDVNSPRIEPTFPSSRIVQFHDIPVKNLGIGVELSGLALNYCAHLETLLLRASLAMNYLHIVLGK